MPGHESPCIWNLICADEMCPHNKLIIQLPTKDIVVFWCSHGHDPIPVAKALGVEKSIEPVVEIPGDIPKPFLWRYHMTADDIELERAVLIQEVMHARKRLWGRLSRRQMDQEAKAFLDIKRIGQRHLKSKTGGLNGR